MQHLGFVGFGEAAYHIAKGLRGEGVSISAYDIKVSEKVRTRANDTAVDLLESPAALARVADVIISAVTADQAVPAAEQNAPHLTSKHLYCDLNSISPKAKERVAAIASCSQSAQTFARNPDPTGECSSSSSSPFSISLGAIEILIVLYAFD